MNDFVYSRRPSSNHHQQGMPDEAACSDEMNRLLCAAVVNQRFCRRLLMAPLLVVRQGYDGYQFTLTEHELNVLSRIRARNISDFARQLMSLLAQDQVEESSRTSADYRARVRENVRPYGSGFH